MHDVKGQRLYVNASAAETRRRLKGRGCGVKKIHSNGRNQAVVIHTAVGEHLERLKGIFADVGCSTTEVGLAEPIQNLRNLGAESAAWLRDAGVHTIADLRHLGAVTVFRSVRRRNPGCSLNLLWALAAGLEGRDWRELPQSEKDHLRRELESGT
jgi:hypothetical protein